MMLLLTGCASPTVTPESSEPVNQTITPGDNDATDTPEVEETNISTPSATPTPDLFASLYGCEMELVFKSGPLESKGTTFTVLGEDYFTNKDDKFKPGKGTGVYYIDQHYFIIHSSFVNGNILRPMEAEFMRKYLEYWGTSGNAYVEGQIDSLIGSDITWTCDGEIVFETKINGITRLSHEASNHLWLNPEDLEQIILDREGLTSEWISEISPIEEPHLYMAFCGWSPDSETSDRFTYYRYLFQFTID